MPANHQWKAKFLNIIKESYRDSNYFDEVFNDIKEHLLCEYEYFSDYSISIIKFLISKLNIDTKLYIDTDFNQDFGISNQRNIALCKKVGGDIYLSGNGAKVYNDYKLYRDNSLDLIYQDYIAPTYVQISDEFIPGLSIIDVIFNCIFLKLFAYRKIFNIKFHKTIKDLSIYFIYVFKRSRFDPYRF